LADLLKANLSIIVAIALIGVWLLLRTRATKVGSGSTLGGLIGGGSPAVLEFFSNT